MLLREAFLAVMGLCAGGVIAAGIFAFLVIIGVYPRLIGKTKTAAVSYTHLDVYKRQYLFHLARSSTSLVDMVKWKK